MRSGFHPGVASFPTLYELITSPESTKLLYLLSACPVRPCSQTSPCVTLTPAHYCPAALILNLAISFSLRGYSLLAPPAQNALALALCRAGPSCFGKLLFQGALPDYFQIPILSFRALTIDCHHAFIYLVCPFMASYTGKQALCHQGSCPSPNFANLLTRRVPAT